MDCLSPARHRIASIVAAFGLLALLAGPGSLQAQTAPPAPSADLSRLDDGPYLFLVGEHWLQAAWICAGKPVRRWLRQQAMTTVPARCGYSHPLQIPSVIDTGEAPLTPGARIIALSDIHGQFTVLRTLLLANGIIDDGDRWLAGRDHLVVAGDVFDRGSHVTESFWLLFSLQQQARAAGGAVHFLLGNHETMVLYDDLRYINPKYRASASLLGRSYPALHGSGSVLGQWLRTRPVLLKLGDTLFLHGGIAPENLDLVAHMAATNAAYDHSLGTPKAQVKADPITARLYDGKRSPIWYRGYFNGELDAAGIAALVRQLGVERIVVGHTTIGEVASFHDGKVIAIDSGIKRGQAGQLLFIEGNRLSRGLMDGRGEPLPVLREVPDDPD